MFVLVIQLAMLVAMFLDIPIARQIIGVVYLSFVPGFLVLSLLRLNPKSRINAVLLSVGLSVAFLMFFGLVVNELYPLMGVSKPLSLMPLSVTLGAILLVMTFISYKRDDLEGSFSLPSIDQALRGFLLLGVPLLAILGALTNSLFLDLMVVAVEVLVLVVAFSKKLIPSKLYPIVIMVIAISLLFQSEFISKYLMGWDVFGEFYVFRLTSANSLWNPIISTSELALLDYNGMLSITILSTMYSNLLNIPGEWLFKYGYYLIYPLVPVVMYQTYRQPFGKPVAFLSAFYFVLFPRFYSEENRQIIGELFLVLLIFTILDRNIEPRKKKILLCIFGAALLVSHYSISYIFMFCVLGAWMIISAREFIIKKFRSAKLDLMEKRLINTSFVLLIFILNFFWYFFVSSAESQTVINFASYVVTSFTTGFLSPGSRGGTVSEFVAPSLGSMTLVYKVDYIVNKIPYFLIIIGFLALAKNYKKMKISLEYLTMVLAMISILLMVLVVPSFAPAFLADRFFHVSLLFLAPVCVYGGVTLLRGILKRFVSTKRARSVSLRAMCIFFIMIFLFKVGFIYQVTGDTTIPRPITYASMKTSSSPEIKAGFYEFYVPKQDVYSAIWLSRMTGNNSKIYADETASMHVLRGYGMIVIEGEYVLYSNMTIEPNSYVYLRYMNVQGVLTENGGFSNITGISNQLNLTDKIYSDGSEIYYSLPGS